MGIDVQGDDKGVADGLDLVALLFHLVIQVDLMLEGVQVNVATVQGVVRGGVVGELDDLQVDALCFQALLCRFPQVFVDAAHHAQLDGGGFGGAAAACAGVTALAAAGSQGQGEGGGGQGDCNKFLDIHRIFLRFFSYFLITGSMPG